jgi:two-component system chemotaxis response regulator CheB
VYIGEPDQHLTLAMQNFGRLVDDPQRAHGNRTIDLLFRSVVRRENGRMIGVVLSGSLDDGSRGLAAIHDAGGLTRVLTPGLLPRKGMPENAIAYDGPIDTIGNPQLIANAIVRAVAKG